MIIGRRLAIDINLTYPLPEIKVSIDKIAAELNGTAEGSFYIKNVGGGKLYGKLFSNAKCITFINNEFNLNNNEIKYIINTSAYTAGSVIKSEAVIISNGGEVIIPIIIKVLPEAVITKTGYKISSLKDFFSFSKTNNDEAVKLLYSNDFKLWLSRTGFEHMEIFENLIKDNVKERALDNLLIISGLKKKAYLTTEVNDINISLKPSEKEPLNGKIKISKIGGGFIEAEIKVLAGADWLKVNKKIISASDFNENGYLFIEYSVLPTNINKKFSSGSICIEEHNIKINIKVFVTSSFSVKLSKGSFLYSDDGIIEIENNSGKDTIFEITSPDSFIKIAGKSHIVSKKALIPFKIKLSAIQLTQITIKKRPFIEGEIIVKTVLNGKIMKKKKNIIVGYSF